jgi:hypothetical protein
MFKNFTAWLLPGGFLYRSFFGAIPELKKDQYQ